MSTSRTTRVLTLLSAAALVLSAIWFWASPHPESALAVVTSLIAILALGWLEKDSRVVRFLFSPLRWVFWPIERFLERRRMLAHTTFKVLRDATLTEHSVTAKNVWSRREPTQAIELRHRSSQLYPYTFDLIDAGHSPRFITADFNGDGRAELAIHYHCGAHTHVLRIYAVDWDGLLKRVAEIGSDWPDITWEDRDGDGAMEIYAKHRNWSGSPTQEFVEEHHVWNGSAYELRKSIGLSTAGPS